MPEGDTGADTNIPVGEMVGVGEEGPDPVQQAAAASVAKQSPLLPQRKPRPLKARLLTKMMKE